MTEQITVDDIRRRTILLYELSQKKEEAKEQLRQVSSSYDKLEAELLGMMEANELDRFDIPECMVLRGSRTSWKTPKTPGERESFFSYLKQQGVYENMITVNSQTLNAWAKEEEAAAVSRGDLAFEIPGLGQPTTTPTLTLRRK